MRAVGKYPVVAPSPVDMVTWATRSNVRSLLSPPAKGCTVYQHRPLSPQAQNWEPRAAGPVMLWLATVFGFLPPSQSPLRQPCLRSGRLPLGP